MEEEGRRLPRWMAGNDWSSWGGVEPGVGLEPAAAAEPRERMGELCWLKALWTHEMRPQLGAACAQINRTETGQACWAGFGGEQLCAGLQGPGCGGLWSWCRVKHRPGGSGPLCLDFFLRLGQSS